MIPNDPNTPRADPTDPILPQKETATTWIILALILIIAAVALVYTPALPGQFILDDVLIYRRPFSRMHDLNLETISNVFFNQTIQPRRGLVHLTFALNHYLTGPSPQSLRLTNVIIHVLASASLFALIRTLLMLPRSLALPPMPAAQAATVAALLFALHPVQTQGVSYIWQRSTCLLAALSIASVWTFTLARSEKLPRSAPLYLLSAAFALLACFTKENAVLIPFLILLVNYVFFSDRTPSARFIHLAVITLTLTLATAAVMRFWFNTDKGLSVLADRYANRDFTLTQRLLTETRILWSYVRLTLCPLPIWMNIDHHTSLSTALFQPLHTAIAAIALIAAIAASLYALLRYPLIAFGLIWFGAAHVPESTIVPLELRFDHRLYLPLVGAAWIAALAYQKIAQTKPRLAFSAATVVALLLAAGSLQRNLLYRDAENLWRDAVAKSPDKPRPHVSLANILLERNRLPEAANHLQEALRLNPDDPDALTSMGAALSAQGQNPQAIEYYNRAITVKPEYADAHYNLGLAYVQQQNIEPAIHHYELALKIRPQYAEAHNNLAIALAATGQFDDAIHHFHQSLNLQPDNAEALFNLGFILIRQGQTERALAAYRNALDLANAKPLPDLAAKIRNQLKLHQTSPPNRK